MNAFVACPGCGQRYALKAEMAGRQVQCRKCGKMFVVAPPATQPTPAAPPPGKPADDDFSPPAAITDLMCGMPLDSAPVGPAVLAPIPARRRSANLRLWLMVGGAAGVVALVTVVAVMLGKGHSPSSGVDSGSGAPSAGTPAAAKASGSPDEVMNALVSATIEAADALAAIRDAPSAQASAARYQISAARLLECDQNHEELKKRLPTDQYQSLSEKHSQRLAPARQRLAQERVRILQNTPLAAELARAAKPSPASTTTAPAPLSQSAPQVDAVDASPYTAVIAAVDETTAILRTITDVPTAEAAAERLRAAEVKKKDCEAKFETWKKGLSQSTWEQLRGRHAKQLSDAYLRATTERLRAFRIKGVHAVLNPEAFTPAGSNPK